MNNEKKHNYKLSSVEKKDILTNYLLDKSTSNVMTICNKYNISRQCIYDLVNKTTQQQQDEIINESIKEYRRNFTKKTSLIIDKLLDRINKELQDNDKIQLSQMTTSLGILYDKMRLNENLSTSNNSIKIDIKIE